MSSRLRRENPEVWARRRESYFRNLFLEFNRTASPQSVLARLEGHLDAGLQMEYLSSYCIGTSSVTIECDGREIDLAEAAHVHLLAGDNDVEESDTGHPEEEDRDR